MRKGGVCPFLGGAKFGRYRHGLGRDWGNSVAALWQFCVSSVAAIAVAAIAVAAIAVAAIAVAAIAVFG